MCYYNAGAMFDIVDPGPANKAEQGVVDEVLRFDIHNCSRIEKMKMFISPTGSVTLAQ